MIDCTVDRSKSRVETSHLEQFDSPSIDDGMYIFGGCICCYHMFCVGLEVFSVDSDIYSVESICFPAVYCIKYYF